jgi:hypothetical protein
MFEYFKLAIIIGIQWQDHLTMKILWQNLIRVKYNDIILLPLNEEVFLPFLKIF